MAVIDQIVWNDDGTLQISFEQKWGDLTVGQTYTISDLATETVASSIPEINFGELVLNKLAIDKTDFTEIEYCTYSTEQTNGNGLVNFQNQFQIEAESDAVIIGFPKGDDGLLSVNDKVESYRLRLNNEDLTDREVSIKGPLHLDRLGMSMTQLQLRLRNLAQNMRNTADQDYIGAVLDNATLTTQILSPVNQTQQEKLLQVNIQCETGSAGVNALSIFKHLPKVFSY